MKKPTNEEICDNIELLDLFFQQSLIGFFFMMLDEPIEWNDNVDKEKILDFIFDHQRITKINRSMAAQYGLNESDFMGMTPRDFFAYDVERGRRIWRELYDKGKLHLDTRERRTDGNPMIIEGDYICIYDKKGRIRGHFGAQMDVTRQRKADIELQRYVEIVDDNVITSVTDLNGRITYASKAFSKISQYTPKELLGHNHNIIRHPEMEADFFKELWHTIKDDRTWHGEIKNRRKDGSTYWVDTYISPVYDLFGNKTGYMAVRQDITDKKEIERMSMTDRLTNVYNRIKLDAVLLDQQTRFERYGETYCAILLDIDHFKSVNDSYGHLVGDVVLRTIAELVQANIRTNDIFGRWGGEEFLIICPHTEVEGCKQLAEKLRQEIEKHKFETVKKITASFGIANIQDVENQKAFFKCMDEALYEAKNSGRNRVITYRPGNSKKQ